MLFRTLITFACLASTAVIADDELFSAFTTAQIKEMARSTIKANLAASTGKHAVTEPDASAKDLMSATQLRGYVAGILEQGKPGSIFDGCRKKHSLTLITHRFALAMDETNDTDGSGVLNALIALANACNDSLWAN